MERPLVSFVIASYNAKDHIGRCLQRVRAQKYPKESIEILVIDGGSTDATLSIAKAYNATVIPNPRRIAEYAKAIGITKAQGKYTVILDTDNEIVSDVWLNNVVNAMEKNPDLVGMDPIFYPKPGDYAINRYCALLQLEDPLVRRMAMLKFNAERKTGDGCLIYEVRAGRFPIFGSNGFMWRTSLLKEIGADLDRYDEADFCVRVVEKGHRKIGVLPEYSIIHHHLKTVQDFIAKRMRRGGEYAGRRPDQKTWLEHYSKKELLLSILACATFVVPFWESLKEVKRTRDAAWLLHPFLSWLTVAAYTISFVKSWKTILRSSSRPLQNAPC